MDSASKRKTLRQRKALLELLFRPGALDLDEPDVMSGAWR